MAREDIPIRVHQRFADNLKKLKEDIEKDTGLNMSMYEITGILSHNLPVIKIEIAKKKKEGIFDF